jgi:hypothetical protein
VIRAETGQESFVRSTRRAGSRQTNPDPSFSAIARSNSEEARSVNGNEGLSASDRSAITGRQRILLGCSLLLLLAWVALLAVIAHSP